MRRLRHPLCVYLFYPTIPSPGQRICALLKLMNIRYLATSGGPIYKVVALNSTADDCSSINGTVDCDPQVSDWQEGNQVWINIVSCTKTCHTCSNRLNEPVEGIGCELSNHLLHNYKIPIIN